MIQKIITTVLLSVSLITAFGISSIDKYSVNLAPDGFDAAKIDDMESDSADSIVFMIDTSAIWVFNRTGDSNTLALNFLQKVTKKAARLFISRNERFLYGLGRGTDKGVFCYVRDTTGKLNTLVQSLPDTGVFTELSTSQPCFFSFDGRNIYTVSKKDSAIICLSLDTATGDLAFVNKASWNAPVTDINQSIDGRFVYILSNGKNISWWQRDSLNGALIYKGDKAFTKNTYQCIGPSGKYSDNYFAIEYNSGWEIRTVLFQRDSVSGEITGIKDNTSRVIYNHTTLNSAYFEDWHTRPQLSNKTFSWKLGFRYHSMGLYSLSCSKIMKYFPEEQEFTNEGGGVNKYGSIKDSIANNIWIHDANAIILPYSNGYETIPIIPDVGSHSVLSATGKYLVSECTNGLASYTRDAQTGKLTFLNRTPISFTANAIYASKMDNIYYILNNEELMTFYLDTATGLFSELANSALPGTKYLIFSPDKKNLYRFTANSIECFTPGSDGVLGTPAIVPVDPGYITGIQTLAFSLDGKWLFVSLNKHTCWFIRDMSNGLLSLKGNMTLNTYGVYTGQQANEMGVGYCANGNCTGNINMMYSDPVRDSMHVYTIDNKSGVLLFAKTIQMTNIKKDPYSRPSEYIGRQKSSGLGGRMWVSIEHYWLYEHQYTWILASYIESFSKDTTATWCEGIFTPAGDNHHLIGFSPDNRFFYYEYTFPNGTGVIESWTLDTSNTSSILTHQHTFENQISFKAVGSNIYLTTPTSLADAEIAMYDLKGCMIKRELVKNLTPGTHALSFQKGNTVPGTYFIKFKAREKSLMVRVLLK
jgi:6-phosphogluconolactonase (cycloisomerase 2 family)